MTDLHEIYTTLLPQHDLNEMAKGRARIPPRDRSHGNAGEVPAVAAPERCGRQLLGDSNGTYCCKLPFGHAENCEQEDTPSAPVLTGPAAGFEMMLYRYPIVAGRATPVEVPGGMYSQWWRRGSTVESRYSSCVEVFSGR